MRPVAGGVLCDVTVMITLTVLFNYEMFAKLSRDYNTAAPWEPRSGVLHEEPASWPCCRRHVAPEYTVADMLQY